MGDKCFFFAGGGTGGHIYPAIAVAEQIARIEPAARIHFFCSDRSIDKHILGQTHFDYRVLPAKGFSIRPKGLIEFYKSFRKSYSTAKEAIGESWNSVVVGAGGFVSAPVCWAAHKCRVPIALINVDIVPGRANRVIARWADEVFVQFQETAAYFSSVVGRRSSVGIRDTTSDIRNTRYAIRDTTSDIRNTRYKPNSPPPQSRRGDKSDILTIITGSDWMFTHFLRFLERPEPAGRLMKLR